MELLRVSSKSITYGEFASLFAGPVRVSLTQDSLRNLKRSHAHFRTQLDAGETIYGVNTGFGNLSHIAVSYTHLTLPTKA